MKKNNNNQNKISNGVKQKNEATVKSLPNRGNCKRYAQAITNSVIGEKVDVPKEELAQHLKECPKCQKEYSNWQDVCDFIRVKEYHARPEVKAKWDNFLKELTAGKLTSKEKVSGTTCQNHIPTPSGGSGQEPLRGVSPKGKIVSVEELFSGETDTIRETVDKHGIVNFDDLPAKSNLPPGIAYGAMVLLAQKKELCFIEHKDHVDLFVPRP